MNHSTNKIFIISLILFGLGIVFLIVENSFYQYIDNTGVLHESMFMPLGMLTLFIGILVLLFFIMQKVRHLLSNM